jgi:phosphoglycolate phosphatase
VALSHAAGAVLFDLDGTLVDSSLAFVSNVNHALGENGFAERPASELVAFLGPPLDQTFATLLAGEEGLPELIARCVEAYRARYATTAAAESRIYDGIEDALDGLAERVPLVVATSKPQAMAESLLDALGLLGRFRAVFGPSMAIEAETKTVTVARALERLAGRRNPAMVGDRRFDVEGAHANGIPCVGVLWGFGSEAELREAGAEAIAGAARELPLTLGCA